MDPGTQISLFKDAYEALRALGSDVRRLTRVPKARRAEAVAAISDAYQLLDLATSLVVAKLGRIVERAEFGDRREFASELEALQSAPDWWEMERSVALCSTLRVYRQELNRTFSGAIGRSSIRDFETAEREMAAVLDNESVLAHHITSTFLDLSKMAGSASRSKAGYERALKAVKTARDALVAQRREFIRAEVELLQSV